MDDSLTCYRLVFAETRIVNKKRCARVYRNWRVKEGVSNDYCTALRGMRQNKKPTNMYPKKRER